MTESVQNQIQISAYVSEGAKVKFDRVAKARGLRKNFMMEQALLYYLRALEELPGEAFLPPRLVLSQDAFQQVVALIENPPPPTAAMLELMNGASNSSASTK